MSEKSQRSFVICGWSLDEDKARDEIIKIAGGNVELAESAILSGFVSHFGSDGVNSDLKIIATPNKMIIGRLIATGFGTNLPYSILAFDRLCGDMDELIKTFDVAHLGLPSIHTGMTESMVIGGSDGP